MRPAAVKRIMWPSKILRHVIGVTDFRESARRKEIRKFRRPDAAVNQPVGD